MVLDFFKIPQIKSIYNVMEFDNHNISYMTSHVVDLNRLEQ